MQIDESTDYKKIAGKSASERIIDQQIASSQLFKLEIVGGEAIAHFLPGVFLAAKQNVQHPGNAAEQLLGYGALGVAARVILPKVPAARALIATTLVLRASSDLYKSSLDAYQKIDHCRTLSSAATAGGKIGQSLGYFAVDSAISLAAGGASQHLTEKTMLSALGYRDFLGFEYEKFAFWNCLLTKHFHLPIHCTEAAFNRLSHYFPAPHVVHLTLDEKLNRICDAGSTIAKQIENERFYKYGPVSGFGQCLDFSDYLDKLLGKTLTPTLDKTKSGKIRQPDLSQAKNSILSEFSVTNMLKLASVVRNRMSSLSNKDIQLIDIKERLKAPIYSESDRTRYGALLANKFEHSSLQLCDLVASIKNQKQLSDVLYILDLHAKSALQNELKLPSVGHLNFFAKELQESFINGIKKAGISSKVLHDSVPSRVTITDDHRCANFTIPPIAGVIDRPVTVFPRNQSNLESVLAGINRHEMSGHDYIWCNLKGFAAEMHDVVLPNAVRQAMQICKVKDTSLEVPGLGPTKKSEFIIKVLQAQANENISDLVGTASGGADSPLSLGLLLQSLRRDGLLETGSFLGSRFEEYVEPHGVDRCRIKWCAEQMRQLAPHNLDAIKQAKALDIYAASASRPGRYYIFANEDTGGQVAISIKELDFLIPHLVKSQLETPLQSLEGKRLKDILPDMDRTVTRIESLTSMMERDIASDKNTLVSMFDPGQHSIGEVYAAGLRTWMRMCAKEADPDKSLTQVSRLSNSLCDLYLKKFR